MMNRLIHIIGMALLLVVVSTTSVRLANPSYISPTGNDSNPGTLVSPYLTMTKCQIANPGGICYFRAGAYAPAQFSANCTGLSDSCGMELTSADNGSVWAVYPPDGCGAASITGGSTASGNGLYSVIANNGAASVTVHCLTIHHADNAAIIINNFGGGATGMVITGNTLHDIFRSSGDMGLVFCSNGCASITITGNTIYNTTGNGIELTSNVAGDLNGTVISGNLIYNTCSTIADCGAVYEYVGGSTGVSTVSITGNYILDGNTAAALGSAQGSAIYLDNCVGSTTVSGNVITGKNGDETLHIHGGSNNTFQNNIIDMAPGNPHIMFYQTQLSGFCSAATMSGNTLQNNIIVSGGGGLGINKSGTPGNAPTYTHNLYWNYAGAAIATTGDYNDAAPITGINPQMCGWGYDISPTSAAFSPPLSFPLQAAKGWGAPGAVFPLSGSLPSPPTACGGAPTVAPVWH